MQTFLDWASFGAAEELAGFHAPYKPKPKLAIDDSTAMREIAVSAARMLLGTPDAAAIEPAMFSASLHSFFLTDEEAHEMAGEDGSPLRPSLFSLHPDVVAALRPMFVTSEIRKLGLQEGLRRRVTYFDLPHGAFMSGADLQLRAVFLFASVARKGDLRYVAVLSQPGSNQHMRLTWYSHDSQLPYVGEVMPCCNLAQGLAKEDLAITDVMAMVGPFVALAMVYALSVERIHPEYLPYLAPGDLRRQGRKGPQNAKKFSLFKVRVLGKMGAVLHDALGEECWLSVASPDSCPAVPMIDSEAPPQPPIPVCGHRRLQPYGKGRLLRRPVWIAPHDRTLKRKMRALQVHEVA
nr:F45 [uncultured bacterium]